VGACKESASLDSQPYLDEFCTDGSRDVNVDAQYRRRTSADRLAQSPFGSGLCPLGDKRRVPGNARAQDGEPAALIAMSYRKMIAGVLIHVALFGGPLFLVAGTLDWWRANGQKGDLSTTCASITDPGRGARQTEAWIRERKTVTRTLERKWQCHGFGLMRLRRLDASYAYWH
jgi:hypothetical protein